MSLFGRHELRPGKRKKVENWRRMASWERVFSKRTGVQVLPYYHMSGCDGYAKEFFDLCLSVLYAQKTNDFVFVFDMINPVSAEFSYFQTTLKKNNFIRHLPYFPSSGFQLRGRQDLIQPILDDGKRPDKIFIYEIAKSLFQFQDKVREKYIEFFTRFEVPGDGSYSVGVCISSVPDIQNCLNKLGDIPRDKTVSVYLQCPSRDLFEQCKQAFPRQWTVSSIQMTGELHTQTTEQKTTRLYAELGELMILLNCPILVGSFENPICRLMGLLSQKFREDRTAFRSIDGKPFRFFS